MTEDAVDVVGEDAVVEALKGSGLDRVDDLDRPIDDWVRDPLTPGRAGRDDDVQARALADVVPRDIHSVDPDVVVERAAGAVGGELDEVLQVRPVRVAEGRRPRCRGVFALTDCLMDPLRLEVEPERVDVAWSAALLPDVGTPEHLSREAGDALYRALEPVLVAVEVRPSRAGEGRGEHGVGQDRHAGEDDEDRDHRRSAAALRGATGPHSDTSSKALRRKMRASMRRVVGRSGSPRARMNMRRLKTRVSASQRKSGSS